MSSPQSPKKKTLFETDSGVSTSEETPSANGEDVCGKEILDMAENNSLTTINEENSAAVTQNDIARVNKTTPLRSSNLKLNLSSEKKERYHSSLWIQ